MTQPASSRIERRLGSLAASLVVCLLVGASGCAKRAPVVAAAPVPLDVPPAPPRVIATPPEPVAPTEASTVERPAPVSRPQRAARGASSRPEVRPAEPARPEATVENAPASPQPEVAAPPGPLLRTPQTADEINAEKRTQDVLGRAAGLLDRVNPKTLGAQARQQHETARRFVAQARQALTERNFVLASYLADKAETLARGLSR